MRGTPVLFTDFAGGVNLLAGPYDLSNREARDARNVQTTSRGAIVKRGGNQTFASTAAQYLSLTASQNPQFLLGMSASTVNKIDTGGVVTSLATGKSNGKWETAVATANAGQGPIFMVNGVDAAQTWDGVTAGLTAWTASAGSLPTGKYLLWFKNRMFIAGDSANPSRLYASNIGNPRDWSVTSGTGWAVDLDPNDGLPITGLGTVGQFLLVFKRNRVYAIVNTDTGANQRIGINVGTLAHRSIIETPFGTCFFDPDKGVYTITPGLALKPLNQNVLPLMLTIQPARSVDAAAGYRNNHYYLSISTLGSFNNLTFDYDFVADSWWIHDFAEQQYVIWEAATGDPQLFGAKAGASLVDKCIQPGVFQDNGANFATYWKSPFYNFQTPYVKKRIRRLRLDGSGHILLYASSNFAVGESLLGEYLFSADTNTFGGSGSFGGTGTFGGSASTNQVEALTLGLAREWSAILRNNSNDGFEVDSMTWAMNVRKN